jgi:hypothetical protein
MIKMLHIAVCDLRQGAVGSSEAEILDILWALEVMKSYKDAEELLAKEKAAKKKKPRRVINPIRNPRKTTKGKQERQRCQSGRKGCIDYESSRFENTFAI